MLKKQQQQKDKQMENNNKKYQIDTKLIIDYLQDNVLVNGQEVPLYTDTAAPITFNVYADSEANAQKAAEDYMQSNYGEELLDAETTITELK
jgi:hypothetical protein